MWLPLLLTVVYGATAGPPISSSHYKGPYKMTFASASPTEAAAFTIKYLGGNFYQQPHKGGDGECAMVKWVTFNNTYSGYYGPYMFHFVKGYDRPNGTMTLDEFESKLQSLHGLLSPTTALDQYMNFRVALSTASLDPFAAAFHRDGIPFLTRKRRVPGESTAFEFSLMVEIPHAIIVELVAPILTVTSAAEWDLCDPMPTPASRLRFFNETLAARYVDLPTPEVQPLRTTYASPDPLRSAMFYQSLMGGELDSAESSERMYPGNGSCYSAHTVLLRNEDKAHANEYEVRWITAPSERTFRNLSVAQFSDYLVRTHETAGNMGTTNATGDVYDEWMDNHIGITFDDMDGLIAILQAQRRPFFTRGQYGKFIDVFVEGPFGQIYEAVAPKQTLLAPSQIEQWNLCGAPGL